MKYSFLLLITMALGILPGALSHAKGDNSPLLYVAFQKEVFNPDAFLEKKLGLHADSCEYKSDITHTVTTNIGLGSCFYLNLNEGFKTEIAPGAITAHMTSIKTHHKIVLEIVWRPGAGGRAHVANRLLKEWRQKDDYSDQDGILGEIRIKFPDGPVDQGAEILDSFGSLGQYMTAEGIWLSEIYISTQSDEWENAVDTSVLFFKKGEPDAFYGMKIATDFNFLHPKKRFHLEAQGQ